MSSAGHALYSPSSASRWLECPSSAVLAGKVPQGPKHPSAMLGTRAHLVAERALQGRIAPDFGGEEAALALPFVNAVSAVKRPGDFLFVEERVQIVPPWCHGTADAIIWQPASRTLWVFDLKTGKHRVPSDAVQLQLYAAGALATFPRAEALVTVVVQPQVAKTPKPAEHEPYEIRAVRERARIAIDKGQSGKAHYRTGEWCRFCPARPVCPAYAAVGLSGLDGAKVYDDGWDF